MEITTNGRRKTLTGNRKMTAETRKATHPLYMDDLKVFAPNDKLTDQLKLVKQYYEDIRMDFGFDKCAKCTFIQGKTKRTDISIDQSTTTQVLENEASYKLSRKSTETE